MKKLTKQDHVFTIDVKEKLGRYGYYHDVIMVDTDLNVYRTYIDSENNNYESWKKIVDNPDRGYVITGCKLKRNNKHIRSEYPIINADSEISIEHEDDIGDLRKFYMDEYLLTRPFDKLFQS